MIVSLGFVARHAGGVAVFAEPEVVESGATCVVPRADHADDADTGLRVDLEQPDHLERPGVRADDDGPPREPARPALMGQPRAVDRTPRDGQ